MVLLADPILMELPLEALAALQNESIVSLSREISLQMLHHKILAEPIGKLGVLFLFWNVNIFIITDVKT